MSGPERPPEPAAHAAKWKPQANLSEEDQKELALLDAAFQRIKRAVPNAPYILSTPSLNPYQHYSRHEARSWMMGHLFTPDEEHLQYRTFHYREPYQDCFVLQPGEEEEPEIERPKSQASTTPHHGPKKKISLSAYKSQKANGVITPASGSKKVSPMLAATKPSPAQTNGVQDPVKQPQSSQKYDEGKFHKRSATDSLVPEKPEKRAKENHTPSQPSSKMQSSEPKITLDKSVPSNATPHGLPPLLSPVDQPLNNPYGLPAILSPTLPSNVQAALDELETQRKRGDSNASTSSSDRKNLLSVPETHVKRSEEDSPKSNTRVRSVSINGKSPSSQPLNKGTAPEPSLIVKLKYGKQNGKRVASLLRLPASRKAQLAGEKKELQDNAKERPVKAPPKAVDGAISKSQDMPKATSRRVETSRPAAKGQGMTTKEPAKRPRSEDDTSLAVPSKRLKPSQDRPSTPAGQIVSSPVMSNKSSAQKAQGPHVTPHKAISMLRTHSTDGSDTTPGRSGSTPSGSKYLDPKAAPTSTPLGGGKPGDYQALAQTSQKLNNMGRTLKHAAQKLLMEKGKNASKEDLKRAAVTSLECIISYMAAYAAQDHSNNLRGRPGDVEATWKTLFPLCMSYARYTKEYPHLEGLRLYLCAVICAAICFQVASRAPRQNVHDSPQGLSNGQLNENFTLIAEHYKHLSQATSDVRSTLPVTEIRKHYTKTWDGREMNSKLAKAPDKPNGGNLSGPYFLPIQMDTTPLQGVRFGLKFLGEYCELQELDYKLRVNLEKPE